MPALLRLRPNYQLTPCLLYLNLLVFVIMALSSWQWLWFDNATLVRFGGNFGPLTLSGQWWRLLSAVFVHAGLLHFLFNQMVLTQVGQFLEPLLGPWRMLALYLCTGLLASLTSLIWHLDAPVISIGASGAIFGLYGFFTRLLLSNLFSRRFRDAFLKGTLVFIGLNLAIGLLGFIDNAAHLGGLISGLLLGQLSLGRLKRRLRQGANKPQD